jgi:hypothetical protein
MTEDILRPEHDAGCPRSVISSRPTQTAARITAEGGTACRVQVGTSPKAADRHGA